MLFYLTSRIISSVAAFLYPGYASYKTLSQRPASEEELERWLMYWSVVGCLTGVEYVAEWIISWIPLYYFFKTIFLLYLALPQTQGSSYLYINHLRPFFDLHETQIDAALVSFKTRVYTFLQERLRLLWQHVAASLGQQQQEPPAGGSAAVSSTDGGFSGFWRAYGPSIIASGTSILRPAAQSTTRPSTNRTSTTQSVLERRRQLEAELAALPTDIDPIDTPAANPSHFSSRASSEVDIHKRERTVSGRFEEIQVPSDVEGYDVGDSDDNSRPAPQRRSSSWFGWGGPGKGSYDRVKSD